MRNGACCSRCASAFFARMRRTYTAGARLCSGTSKRALLAASAGTGNVTADVAGFFRDDDFPGVGRIHTRWRIDPFIPADARALFITVRSEGTGALSGARSRAEFTTIRTCTNAAIGC